MPLVVQGKLFRVQYCTAISMASVPFVNSVAVVPNRIWLYLWTGFSHNSKFLIYVFHTNSFRVLGQVANTLV